MTKILDVVKPGVITGDDVQTVLGLNSKTGCSSPRSPNHMALALNTSQK